MNKVSDIVIVGGGAAGFFTAINIAKNNPNCTIKIIERGKTVLNKVKVSGGGRCNVTHACFDPKELVSYYPRGGKELLGPFHKFSCGDTFAWFEERGVALKIEEDGRVFPETNTSQTIIDCFLHEAKKFHVEVITNTSVKTFSKVASNWEIVTNSEVIYCKALVLTTGSNQKIWNILKLLGHNIINPVPSLFTFNISDERIKDIPGVVVPNVSVKVKNTHLTSYGALLITHWGLSAPAILKLSAYGARTLADMGYKFQIEINFLDCSFAQAITYLKELKQDVAKTTVSKVGHLGIPKRLWKKLVAAATISEDLKWADLNNNQLQLLAKQLTEAVFNVTGKSTFKEEFVTAGGIDLKEVNFKNFESKLHSNLFFSGEILNIDAVTGGFNFQNAWTGAYITANYLSSAFN